MALAILLVAAIALPSPVYAAPQDKTQVEQQIKNIYRNARRYFGRTSFDGFCGAYVSAQVYLLGITSQLIGGDGKDQYNTYARMEYTDCGYRVKAYPAQAYTLQGALNTITQNGNVDAYNILVGFEKTRSSAGRRYGHASFIHAILDGIVYFSECYDVGIKNKYYKEGSTIALPIDEYAKYYSETTLQLDGVIHFGLKTYAERCTFYSSSFFATAQKDAEIRMQPCTNQVHESATVIRLALEEEQLEITGLYLNTVGEYWYQINGGAGGYIRAEQVAVGQLITDDVSVNGMQCPTVLRQGRGYNLRGVIVSQNSTIVMVRAQVYQYTDAGTVSVFGSTDTVNSKTYNLKNSQISDQLAFRKLSVGQYRFEMAAILCNYYVENGQIQARWDSVNLWQSDFQVTASTTNSDTVVFDACGGVSSLNQIAVPVGQNIGALPIAQRLDYVFLGWYTEQEGGERVTADYIPADSTTLYAHWTSIEQLNTRWQNGAECWYFYSDGISTVGCIEMDGILYYFSTVDPANPGQVLWTAAGVE